MKDTPLAPSLPAGPETAEARGARLDWWADARFGMFVHWGLYSLLGRGEWVMACEGIRPGEYERLADRFVPGTDTPRRWAALAKQAGMRYVVLTTKHHDGFCLFDSALTAYCAPKRAAGRDLVREFVEAVRAAGLRVGLYYSLMDWHHPDTAKAATEEAARRRLVDYTHGQLRELLTHYGRIDILWYDSPSPLDAGGWEADRMNDMALALQPHIVLNDRNGLPGDFTTFERQIPQGANGRPWEACMTTNESWGYHGADDWWKSPKELVGQLVTCARNGGNYLLNIGPRADGTVPLPAADALRAVGDWLARNGASIYGSCGSPVRHPACALFTRKGRTLFVHVRHWPGGTFAVAGLRCRVAGARLLATGAPVAFDQSDARVRFMNMPQAAPDAPITTLAVECVEEPGFNQKEYGDEVR
jgi:alpha-L-fucosidase